MSMFTPIRGFTQDEEEKMKKGIRAHAAFYYQPEGWDAIKMWMAVVGRTAEKASEILGTPLTDEVTND